MVSPHFHWHLLFFLGLFCCVFEIVAYRWISRKLPCDVKVNQNSSDIIFDCSGRQLKDVPIDIPGNATKLLLSENRIHNISSWSFKNLLNLTMLNFNWNRDEGEVQITKGTFSNLSKLQELFLDGNSLYRIPEELPSGLQILSLKVNSIIKISKNSFSKVENLTEIYLDKNCYFWNRCNNILDIDNESFAHLNKLQILSLSFNNLTYVPQQLPRSLQMLNLSSNRIQCIREHDFKNLTELKVLVLSGNCPRCHNAPFPCEPCINVSIEIHSKAFENLWNLKQLHLSGNCLKILKSSWFSNFHNLKSLYLSFNFLSGAIAGGSFLNYLPLLEKIDLSFNYDLKAYPQTLRISPNFSKLKSLQTLLIAGYVFREIHHNDLSPLFNLKNLSVINLGTNFIVHTNLSVFLKFSNLKLVYLSENRLAPVSQDKYIFSGIREQNEQVFYKSPLVGNYISGDQEIDYELSHLLVKHECFVYGEVLDLSSNNIFFISPEQFEGFEKISCLNLSKNGVAAALNGTEFIKLPKLKYLDLTYNKIDLAYDYAFTELKELEVLDLSFNPHYFAVSGVTHNLAFLKHLQFLKVLNLSWNEIFTLTTKEMISESLEELQFQGNRLDKLWKKNDGSYIRLFENLTNLSYLDISYNKLNKIPSTVYASLPQNISKLCLSHNELTCFDWEELKHLRQLKVLDLQHNKLTKVSADLTNYTKTLQILNLSYNRITHLFDGFLRGAKSLLILDLSHNKLRLINQSTFLSGPDNYLEVLSLKGNPFQCTCELLEFILWIETNDVDIPLLATDVSCAMPANRKGIGIIYFDLKECIDDSKAAKFSFLSSFFILFTMTAALTMHLFYWDAWYICHYLKAKMKGYHYLKSTESIYDAFITYDTKDPVVSDWVLNHLRVQLEENGEKLFPICLEERDWHPGAPVIDNLSQSIKQSRKTVFVLTEGYVKSGTFKIAFYLAHQRLLDDNTDVIVLVLLEPVLKHSQFFRLRKRLCRKTILEWPTNPHAEKWFWHCLRNIIRVEHQAVYNKLYTSYFTSR
nr:PREDICTED: toll-like receptor 8 [Lepisosteus oculatus]